VSAELKSGTSWPQIFSATFPPGSVSGAPKSSALRIIGQAEPTPRGPYCGAIGWVDGERASLAVGIRTFWRGKDNFLRFGTGAGITWGSNARAEWEETELKAARLIGLASGGEVASLE
jgi:para-aminobenzoate synthetase component 1